MAWSVNEKTVVRAGAGIFHNRVTLNDSTLLGGDAPVQVKQGVSNGLADNPAGASVQRTFPLVMTMQDLDFPHPMSYKFSLSVQRELPFDMVADLAYGLADKIRQPSDLGRVAEYEADEGLQTRLSGRFEELTRGPEAPDPWEVAKTVAELVSLPTG